MIKLSQHIEYLLSSHDCVIIPGWGAMIGHYVTARFVDNDNRLLPPSRQIAFNPALTHNDGLLAGSLMRRHGLSYDAACQAIEQEVDTMRHQLAVSGEVALEHVGLFKNVEGGTPVFEPAATTLSTARYLALPAFDVRTVKQESLAQVEETQAEETIDNEIPAVRFSRFKAGLLKVAASVAVFACVVSVLTLPIGPNKTSIVSMASMGIDINRRVATETPVKDVVEPGDGVLSIAMPGDDSHSVIDTTYRAQYRAVLEYRAKMAERRAARRAAVNTATTNTATQSTVAPLTLNDNDPYCLIVSSHASRAEAERYIAKHASTPMKILEQDGRYRVYIATGKSSSQARAALSAPGVSSRFPGAWVCGRLQ